MPNVLEYIGVRAVIQDVQRYIQDGRRIEDANRKIAAASQNVGQVSTKASFQIVNANTKAVQSIQQLTNAHRQEAKAFAEAQRARAAAAQATAQANAQAAQIARAGGLGTAAYQAAKTSDAPAIAAQLAAEQKLQQASSATAAARLRAGNAAVAASQAGVLASQREMAARKRLQEQEEALARLRRDQRAALAGGAALAGAGAVGLGTVAAVKSAASYETALAKIDALTDATTEQTKELSEEILKLADELPVSPDELGAAAYFVLSSGIKDVDEALRVTRDSARAAAAGLGETEQIASLVTSVLNAYGEENITSAQTVDILLQAVKEGKAEAAGFANSLGRVIPVASNLGVKFTDLAAATAAITNTGANADEATTALLGILRQLSDPSAQAREALESVNLSIEGIRQSIQDNGLVETLYTLRDAFGGNVDKIAALLPEVRGLNGFMSAFVVQGDSARRIMDSLENSTGSVQGALEVMSQTFDYQAGILQNQLRIALVQIGSAVLPSVTKSFKDLNIWMKANREEIVTLGQTLTSSVVTGVRDLVEGISVLIDGFNLLIEPLSWIIGNEAAVFSSITAIGIAFAWALPGGPVLVGLGLLVVTLGKLKNMKIFKGVEDNDLSRTKFRRDALEAALAKYKATIGKPGQDKEINPEKVAKVEEAIGRLNEEIATLEGEATKAAAASKLTANQLGTLKRGIGGLDEEAKKSAEELAKLKDEFVKASEAAGGAQSLFAGMERFGEISRDLAGAMGLSAEAAGNVQGYDAVVRATERANSEAFEFSKAMGTVAYAFERSASVARQIVLDLARAALQASQAAASALFARPTREVANLNVDKANADLGRANYNNENRSRNNARTKELEKQLKSIDAAIKEARKANQKRDEAAQKEQERRRKEQQRAQQAQEEAARQAEALRRYAQIQADQAAERQLEALQKLIDATHQTRSTLRDAFLKSNEDLQRQINEAIGRGDTQGALGLVERQRSEADAYLGKDKQLENQLQQQEKNLRLAQEAERERQRQVELQNALNDTLAKNKTSLDDNTESTSSNTEANESNIESLENSKEAIQDQIDAISAEGEAEDEKTQKIQDQIDVYEAQTAVLQAMVVAADQTLLTQAEQRAAAYGLIEQIRIESGWVRDLSNKLGKSLIPEIDESKKKFSELRSMMDILTNQEIRQKFIIQGIDPAAKRLAILGGTTEQLNVAFAKLKKDLEAAKPLYEKGTIKPPNVGSGGLAKNAMGGIYDNPLKTWVGDDGAEAIIPLTKPARAREILGQISPSVMASIAGGKGGTIISPVTNVTGETLEAMEGVAVRAAEAQIRAAFRTARNTSVRSGASLSSGIGPLGT